MVRLSPIFDFGLALQAAVAGAAPGFFLRRGCARLLLYFNTNKPHSFFFWQNTSCIRKLQVISGRGGAHPLHPPPRSAPELIRLSRVAKSGNWNKPILKMLKANDVAGQLHRLSQPRPQCLLVFQYGSGKKKELLVFVLLCCYFVW